LQIPGMEYLEININGKAFEHFLVKQLSAWSFVKLVSLMACGYRTEAIGIMAREVMTPRGLVGLGCDTMDYCGAEIVTVNPPLHPQQKPILTEIRHCAHSTPTTQYWCIAHKAKIELV
jgi:protein-tyrosine phosphatase